MLPSQVTCLHVYKVAYIFRRKVLMGLVKAYEKAENWCQVLHFWDCPFLKSCDFEISFTHFAQINLVHHKEAREKANKPEKSLKNNNTSHWQTYIIPTAAVKPLLQLSIQLLPIAWYLNLCEENMLNIMNYLTYL